MKKYIKELHIYNFQSHRESHFEFSPDLNVIVGPSDQGKSAVIRALRWLMYNKPQGDEFIRAGASQCKVRVVLSDGTVVERIRSAGGRINRYVLTVPGEEPQVFENFGKEKDIPLEIRKAIGIYRLVVDSDQVLELNMAQQLDAPFLLAETAGKRHKILGRIANLHIVDSAKRQVENDIKRCKSQANQIEQDISAIKVKLEEYADLEEQQQNLAHIEDLLLKINALANTEIELVNLSARRLALQDELKKYETVIIRMSGLPQAEADFHAISDYIRKMQEIENLNGRYKQLIIDINKCGEIINKTAGTEQLEETIEKLKELREQGARLQQLHTDLQKLLADKNKKLKELQACRDTLKRLEDIEAAEKQLTVLTELMQKQQEMEQIASDYGLKKERLLNAENVLQLKIKELTRMVDEYGQLLKEAGRCPTCFTVIDAETIERIHEQLLL